MSSPLVCPNCRSSIGSSTITDPQTREIVKKERYCIGGCGWRELVEYKMTRFFMGNEKERGEKKE